MIIHNYVQLIKIQGGWHKDLSKLFKIANPLINKLPLYLSNDNLGGNVKYMKMLAVDMKLVPKNIQVIELDLLNNFGINVE